MRCQVNVVSALSARKSDFAKLSQRYGRDLGGRGTPSTTRNKTGPGGVSRLGRNLLTHNRTSQGHERGRRRNKPFRAMLRNDFLEDAVAPHEMRRCFIPESRLIRGRNRVTHRPALNTTPLG